MIMIAGGIGITPMLSMLRFMADHRDPRPVTLIWANRSPERVVYVDEMAALSDRLTGLRQVSFTHLIQRLENGQRDWTGKR
jgi:ferredoxin-NADP reductase